MHCAEDTVSTQSWHIHCSEAAQQLKGSVRASAECIGAVTGPEEEIKPLLEQLKAEGVFVRELDTRGLAFHSPVLQSHLGELKEGEQPIHLPRYFRIKCSRDYFVLLHII